MNPNHKVNHRLAAKMIIRGATHKEALEAAGYSENTASTGALAAVRGSRSLREALADELKELAMAKEVLPIAQSRADVIRTQLMFNMLRGAKPGSNEAAKLLGQDREVNMWEPEAAIGIQVNISSVPADMRDELLEKSNEEPK